MRRVHGVLFVVVALACVTAGTAWGVKQDPTVPSAAATLQMGTPYTGSFSRTDEGYGWIRLPATVHRKDVLQLAVSNDPGAAGVHFCAVPPVDDFGADAAVSECGEGDRGWTAWVGGGKKSRLRLAYAKATGQGYLVAQSYCGNCVSTYTITLESISTWIGVGWRALRTVPRAAGLVASARYGDNGPAADGTVIRLMWKPTASPRSAWRKAGQSATKGGKAVLRVTLPTSMKGKRVNFMACAGDLDGCAQMSRVKVT